MDDDYTQRLYSRRARDAMEAEEQRLKAHGYERIKHESRNETVWDAGDHPANLTLGEFRTLTASMADDTVVRLQHWTEDYDQDDQNDADDALADHRADLQLIPDRLCYEQAAEWSNASPPFLVLWVRHVFHGIEAGIGQILAVAEQLDSIFSQVEEVRELLRPFVVDTDEDGAADG